MEISLRPQNALPPTHVLIYSILMIEASCMQDFIDPVNLLSDSPNLCSAERA